MGTITSYWRICDGRLCSELIEASRVDITDFREEIESELGRFGDQLGKRITLVWTKTWMGLKILPLCAAVFYHLAEEFAKGDHLEKDNSVIYDRIILNLPGSNTFNPPLCHKMERH